jgi:hypothetical protein
MIFATRVNGVPCQCKVTYYEPARPMRITGSGFGDADPPEGPEFDFKILDRNGRHAPWLERYLSPEISQQLCDDYQIMFLAEQHQDD